jgi:hypothetical protein
VARVELAESPVQQVWAAQLEQVAQQEVLE